MKICIYFQTLTSLLLLGSLFGWLGVAVLSSLAFFECFPVHKFILLRLLKLNTKICRQSDKPGKKCKDKFNIHILQHSVFSNIPFDNWRRICWASSSCLHLIGEDWGHIGSDGGMLFLLCLEG